METAGRFFMFNVISTSLSKINLPDFHQIAINTGFIVRKSSKMCASGFVQTMINAAVSGRASYNQLADALGRKTGDPMSRQGMEKRFTNDACLDFMGAVHEAILQAQFLEVGAPLKNSLIKRVVVEDSSGQAMPKSNAGRFPGHGNHHGPTAGVKVDFTYDVASNTIITHTLHGATEQDKTIGKDSVIKLDSGDLSLRDMGYFCLSEFTYIEGVGAYWLSRLPLNVGVRLSDETSLETLLKHSNSRVIDQIVYVGEERKKCRLVAIRADRKTANERRRKRKKEAKEKGKTVSAKALIRDGWHIMVTNLKAEEFSAENLAAIYRIRWGVEIQFRAWKQSMNLGKALNRKSKENHMKSLIIGAMIAHLLAMLVCQVFATEIGLEKLSHEKLFEILVEHQASTTTVEDLLNFEVDTRHISRDKRSRKIPLVEGLAALA